jgi:hypothetical protein
MSSSGALIQLVSKGVQDAYLTGDPQVSFWRQAYKRHTNFAMAPARIDYIGTFGASNEVTIKVPRLGDLLSYMWIEGAGINATSANTSLFERGQSPTTFELYIGGQLIDRCDSLWQRGVWNKYYQNTQAKASSVHGIAATSENASNDVWDIPFFFSDDWKSSLPLVALQYHEVEIRIKCHAGMSAAASNIKVYGAYAFLDDDERKHFAENPHEILMRQTQDLLMTNTDTTVDVSYFNHPVKSISIADGSAAQGYTFTDASLYLNGSLFTDTMTPQYYRYVTPRHHTKNLAITTLDDDEVYTTAFCLSMSDTQPTGSCNFSRLDNAKFQINAPTGGDATGPIRVYAVNYNILRIRDGLAGIAFSN